MSSEVTQSWEKVSLSVYNYLKIYILQVYVNELLSFFNPKIFMVVKKYALRLPPYVVDSELDVDLGESFIGEQGLGIAVIAEEVVSAFDVDIEYESARFHSGQWLVMADAIAFEELAQEGFVFDSYRELSSLGFILAEVSAPSSFNITTARAGVLDVVGAGRASVDLNHYYTAGISIDSSAAGFQPASAIQLPNNIDQLPLKIGVIDSLVDLSHPGLKSSKIEVENFTRRGAKQPESHGTAVTSIIAASGRDYAGLIPHAEVFAASVFEEQRHHGDTANAVSLIRALDWLLSKKKILDKKRYSDKFF